MIKRMIIITCIIVFSLIMAIFTIYSGAFGPLGLDTRLLGKLYVYFTYQENSGFSTDSLESVTAIVWDFRGLDTLYETTVFSMAIIAIYTLFHYEYQRRALRHDNFSVIVKTITKLLIPINIALATSIAIHGSVSPGGGFQAGSMLAVIGVILVVVFSSVIFNSEKINPKRTMIIMNIALLGIVIVCVIPVIYDYLVSNAYFMQNQPKIDSNFGYPGKIDEFITGGSISLFNIFEFITVAFGFITGFALLSIPEYSIREEIGEEEREHE